MTPMFTDRKRLSRQRTRARALPALFLHEVARDEIKERLSEVNKSFTAPAIVTPFPEVWQSLFPAARIVEDAETLPLEPAAHDLVVHAMALHWADDPVGQLIQCRRALRPDGLMLAVVPGGRTLHELRSVLAEVETRVRGGLSPRVLPMADIRDLGALLQRAGLALPVTDAATVPVSYRSARALMRDLRAMGEGNALAARDRRPLNRAFFEAADRLYARRFPTKDGRVAATFEMIYLTGWAPDASQPAPLRPGSAARRLADALGVDEISTGDAAGPKTS